MKINFRIVLVLYVTFVPSSLLGGYVPLVRLVVAPQEYVNSQVRTVGMAQLSEGDFGVPTLWLFTSREQAELGIDGIICSTEVVRKRDELMELDGKWVMVEGRFTGPKPKRKRPFDTLSYSISQVTTLEEFRPMRRGRNASK